MWRQRNANGKITERARNDIWSFEALSQTLMLSISLQIATRVMGIETSQLSRHHRRRDPLRYQPSPNSPIRTRGPDWSVVDTVLLEDWVHGTSDKFGFDLFEEYCPNFKVHKRPWSQFVITHKDFHRKETKLCSFPCAVAETGREEHISWRVKSASVLAISDQIVVIQVVVTKAVKILVADWHTDALLGTYTFSYMEEPCLQECFISPDSRTLLLRQNFQLRRTLGHVACFNSNIRVIKIDEGLCKRLYVIRDSLILNCYGSGISFDPRHNSYIAIISSASQSVEMETSQGSQKYDLESRETILTQPACTDNVVHHIRYSPDGQFLAVLCVGVVMGCMHNNPISVHVVEERIQLLNGVSLELLCTLPQTMEYGPCRVLHIQMFPTFSRDCSYIAQFDSTHGSAVRVHFVPSSFDSLKEAARRVILRRVQRRHIRKLPLPQLIKHYLLFREDMP